MKARKNQIFVGSLTNPAYTFENDDLRGACPTSQAVALVGQELSIDVFTPTVADTEEHVKDIYHFRSADGREIQLADGSIYTLAVTDNPAGSDLINLPDGTPVWYYHEDKLVGKFYTDSVPRLGKNKYKLSCVSAIGRLEKKYHGGGLFLSTTFGAVLAHILADGLHGSGVPVIGYTIDDDVAAMSVSGWLPYATKRSNLHQLIFAHGVNIIRNPSGDPHFTFLYTTPSNAEEISADDIYTGGSVEYTPPYSQVVVTEHTFVPIATADASTLFDNSSGDAVQNEEIWFNDAPVIVSTLTATEGLTVVSATENSAVLTGTGVLTGVPYTHTTRTVSASNASAPEEKTVTVDSCTMVNVANSQNLLNRLFAFYCPDGHIKKIKNAIVLNGQRCGKAYRFLSPYREPETAFLASMDIRASAVNKASCEFYAAYEPAGQSGLYQHCIILDKATFEEDGGVFTVPEGVTQLKVVLIGGGTGGGSGWPGENGGDAYCHTNVEQDADLSAMFYGAEGGDGGAGGAGGSPGRVRTVVIENPATSYVYTIGDGGAGGAATGFIPDTADELRAALEAEHPEIEYTEAQISAMLADEAALTDWTGAPNAGSAGTATTFGVEGGSMYSTADPEAYVPLGGVYEPFSGEFFALSGHTGIRGGKGGARKVQSGGTFTWVTDGEDVVGEDGTAYHGGRTGRPYTSVSGLPEANLIAYGGNGAGAAVGLDRDTHPRMDGGSDQSATWEVTT